MKEREALIFITCGLLFLVALLATIIKCRKEKKKLSSLHDTVIKNDVLFKTCVQWVSLRQKGLSLVSFFHKYGYQTIAIYGMGVLGERLVDELKESDIAIKYVIDRNAVNIITDFDIYDMSGALPATDAIVVTAIYHFDMIEQRLKKLTNAAILSLEDIIYVTD